MRLLVMVRETATLLGFVTIAPEHLQTDGTCSFSALRDLITDQIQPGEPFWFLLPPGSIPVARTQELEGCPLAQAVVHVTFVPHGRHIAHPSLPPTPSAALRWSHSMLTCMPCAVVLYARDARVPVSVGTCSAESGVAARTARPRRARPGLACAYLGLRHHRFHEGFSLMSLMEPSERRW